MKELFSKLKRPFNGTWDAVESNMAVFEYIMIRLPVKSILMFKSVSKHWYNVISTRYFMISHFNWSRKNPKFFAFYDARELEENMAFEMYLMEPNGAYTESYTIPVSETLQNPLLLASFNGLIFFMNNETSDETLFDMALHICNPATHEVLVLPHGHMSFDKPIFGVLHSNKSHVYKIFKFFSDSLDPEKAYSLCEVYSSKTGKWKLIADVPKCTLMFNPCHSLLSNHVCVNEKLYWLVYDVYEDEVEFPTSILTVDMEDNFRQFGLPTCADYAFLIEFRGRLCFVEWRVFNFLLWLYNENNGGWYLLDIVKVPGNCSKDTEFDTVAAHEDEILFVYRDVTGVRHEMLYDVSLATWKDFSIAEDAKDKAIAVFPFFETLLPCYTHWSWRPQRPQRHILALPCSTGRKVSVDACVTGGPVAAD